MFYTYGMGAVWHSLRPNRTRMRCNCPYRRDLPSKHPLLYRHEWRNRRHYWKNLLRVRVWHWELGRMRILDDQYFDYGRVGNFVDKVASKLLGDPHPKNYISIPLHPLEENPKV